MKPGELLARSERQPPIDILRAAHAELLVTDLEVSAAFYVEALGLVETARSEESIFLRGWEERHHHSLVLTVAGQPAIGHLAFRVGTEEDLDTARSWLAGRGIEAAELDRSPGHGRSIRFLDPGGFPIELFHQMEIVDSNLRRYDLHRGAPIMRFDHLNFHVPEIESAVEFWLALGFRCTEFIATDGPHEQLTGAWLRRKPTVHDLAFTAGRGPRLHHTGLYVAEPAGILRSCDELAAAGYASSIERGPGRHGVSNAFFVYLRDPDGHRIELYSCDYYTGDPDLEPLRWSVNDPRCRTFWGMRAPDSWYEESSTVLDLAGRPIEITEPVVDERSELAS
jgi:catechol 2,3-dioxygenase